MYRCGDIASSWCSSNGGSGTCVATKPLPKMIAPVADADEVASVLERLSNCDGVKAVSMDMSTTFREAVQLCLPRFPHKMEIVVISDVEYIIRASLYRIFPTNKKEGHWKYDTHLYASSDPFAGSNRF